MHSKFGGDALSAEIEYFRQMVDELAFRIEKKPWIDQFLMFFHHNQKSTLVSNFDLNYDEEAIIDSAGVAVLIQSKTGNTAEYRVNISQLGNLPDRIEEPKSKGSIKVSSLASLSGEVSPISAHSDSLANFVDSLPIHDFMSKISAKVTVGHNQEFTLIQRNLDNPINYTTDYYRAALSGSLQVPTQFKVIKTISRKSLRTLANTASELLNTLSLDLVALSVAKFKFPVAAHKGIILPPDILGELLLKLFTLHPQYLDSSLKAFLENNIRIYEDPAMIDGTMSRKVDDLGKLISARELTGSISTLNTKNDLLNQQKFRIRPFENLTRSYQYDLRGGLTNIILQGGLGQGSEFSNRAGTHLQIKSGQIEISGSTDRPIFLINVDYGEIWINGIYSQPFRNVVIYGSLTSLIQNGVFSKDKIPYTNDYLPASVYCGWLWIDRTHYSLHISD